VGQLEHAVHGVAVSGKQCAELLRSLPAGFGWSMTSTGKLSYAMEDATECFDLLLNELRSAGCGCIKWRIRGSRKSSMQCDKACISVHFAGFFLKGWPFPSQKAIPGDAYDNTVLKRLPWMAVSG
jgi:hypothetical protein